VQTAVDLGNKQQYTINTSLPPGTKMATVARYDLIYRRRRFGTDWILSIARELIPVDL